MPAGKAFRQCAFGVSQEIDLGIRGRGQQAIQSGKVPRCIGRDTARLQPVGPFMDDVFLRDQEKLRIL